MLDMCVNGLLLSRRLLFQLHQADADRRLRRRGHAVRQDGGEDGARRLHVVPARGGGSDAVRMGSHTADGSDGDPEGGADNMRRVRDEALVVERGVQAALQSPDVVLQQLVRLPGLVALLLQLYGGLIIRDLVDQEAMSVTDLHLVELLDAIVVTRDARRHAGTMKCYTLRPSVSLEEFTF